MARRSKKEKVDSFDDDDLPTILPLPDFTHRPAQVGSRVWVVSQRRERATLCEVKEITDNEVVVSFTKDGKKSLKMNLPRNHLHQVDQHLYRIVTD